MAEYKDLIRSLRDVKDQDKGITIIYSKDAEEYIPYAEVWRKGNISCNILKGMGAVKGTEVIIQCKNLKNLINALWACLLGGFIAIPVDSGHNDHKAETNDKVYNKLNDPFLVYDDSSSFYVNSFDFQNKSMNIGEIDFSSLTGEGEESEIVSDPQDVIYVQFSSGSTGEPKGAVIRKSNISANISGMIERLHITKEDKVLSWQPLTHCYGLTVFHLLPIVLGISQFLIPTEVFMLSPLLWMEKINQYRINRLGTIPFALKHVMSFYKRSEAEYGWDLSCIKSITIGGEQVTKEVCKEFTNMFKRYQLSERAMLPIYGLSEATTCVSLLEPDNGLVNHRIGRAELEIGKKVSGLHGENSNQGMTFLELGKPLYNVEAAIKDEEKKDLPEEHIGYIYVKGPSVATGYYNDEKAAIGVFNSDGWLNTGDIGLMVNGNLVVAGREKELIVVNGTKYLCIDIEDIIHKKVLKEPFGQIIVCNGMNYEKEAEQAVVFVENSFDIRDEKIRLSFIELGNKIKEIVFDTAGLTIEQVLPVDRIPKTSSGKIRRKELTNRFNEGEFLPVIELLGRTREKITPVFVMKEPKYLTQNDIRQKIVEVMERILQLKVTDFDAAFKSYGIISVNIPSFIEEMDEIFGMDIPMASFFNNPSVNQFSQYIYSMQNAQKPSKEHNNEVKIPGEEDKIAIIGVSCRFPGGANNIEQYWEVLTGRKDGICDVPSDRWDLEKYYDSDENSPGKMYCRKGGFLEVPIDEFDARFFNISPKEAMALDPQQRLMLELTWEAFENAGLDVTKYSGTDIGVYLGMSTTEYMLANIFSGDLSRIDAYSLTGTCMSTACGRISYTFGFTGPSITVDTACSSSLSALHIACKGLKDGEASLSVVGGINLMGSPALNVGFSKLHATSVDGHSKAFDESANGYGRGEGGGVILLKRLSEAVRDKDTILGVICGTGINQDGKSNGLTAPNGESQVKLIQNTLKTSHLSPLDIDYMEMHGTGTKLGDPIEVGAVIETYCKDRELKNSLKIGSVKSNIGHLEAASGIASIIKVLLSFKNELLPANLHFNHPNPFIPWEGNPIKVVSEPTHWEKGKKLRRAGISGFGFGGSNAHVILEEFRQESEKAQLVGKGIEYILKISAKNEKSLNRYVENYAGFIKGQTEESLGDVIYSADRGRADFDCRLAVTGKSTKEISERLEAYLEGADSEGIYSTEGDKKLFRKERKLVFMFTGQGSQYINMGQLLYKTCTPFKEAMDLCDKLFKPYILKSVLQLLYGENANSELIQKTVYAQPLIFSIEYALFKFWESLGVKPEIVMGHSIGEYAAAVVSEIFTLEDAVKLVSIRGRLMDSAPGSGAMGTIFADKKTVTGMIEEYKDAVSIAAQNAEDTCVISGVSQVVEEILKKAEETGFRINRLKVSHGFHSQLMEPIMGEFEEIAGEIRYAVPKVRFISSLHAKEIGGDQILDSRYWTDHLRGKVDFYHAITGIKDSQEYFFLEVGSAAVLSALCRLIFGEDRLSAPTLTRKKAEGEQVAQTIALLYAAGVNIKWENIEFYGKKTWNKVPVPGYPYDKSRFWSDLIYDRKENKNLGAEGTHRFLGQKIISPILKNTVIFQSVITGEQPYFMKEHIIFDTPITPAAAYISMLLSSVKAVKDPASVTFKEIELRNPLAVIGEEERLVQICLEETDAKEMKYRIVSRDLKEEGDWLTHTQGIIACSAEDKNNIIDLRQYEEIEFTDRVEDGIYASMHRSGFNLGEGFRRITKSSCGGGKGICYIEPLSSVPDLDMYVMYPGVIDSIFQTMLTVVFKDFEAVEDNRSGNKTTIPYYFGSITYHYRESKNLWCRIQAGLKEDIISGDIDVMNEKGEILMEIKDFMTKITTRESLLRDVNNACTGLYYNMEWIKEDFDRNRGNAYSGMYVVIAEDLETNQTVCRKLQEKNHNVISVIPGDSVRKTDKGRYYVKTSEREGWEKLLLQVGKDCGNKKFEIIYCCGADRVLTEDLKNIEGKDIKGLMYLVQSVMNKGLDRQVKIKIVTSDVSGIEKGQQINLSQSLIWGFSKTLSVEIPQIFGGIVDIDTDGLKSGDDGLILELTAGDTQEICLRKGQRYISRLMKNTEYIKNGHKKEEKLEIKEEGSYLITGGSGAIGLVYAEYLADQGAKNIVLLCRKEPKEAAKDRILALRKKGVRVEIVFGDVCDKEKIKNIIKEMASELPDICGVIHAAGIINDKVIGEQTWEDFEKVLNPKVLGLLNIYKAVDKEKLDFFIMLSSVASVLGNYGQSNYGAANYFMNRFASFLNRDGVRGYACCFGPWQGGGMAAGNDTVSRNLENLGIKPLEPETACETIRDFFRHPCENLVIADIDWRKYNENIYEKGKKKFLSMLVTENGEEDSVSAVKKDSTILEELKILSREEREEMLLDRIQKICGKIMGFGNDQLPAVDLSFKEQGVDSLMIFSMRSAINKLLNVELNVSTFFNYPTMVKLTRYMNEEVLFPAEEEVLEEDESTEDLLAELAKLTV